ncbi:MAG: hypothetical protein HY774_13700 [Acidobacteria bacterium]|nr:hypothetical protein [Acidobacteriota bacterium]
MKCPECGTDAREGTRFCRSCGELLTDATGPLTNPPSAMLPTPAPPPPLVGAPPRPSGSIPPVSTAPGAPSGFSPLSPATPLSGSPVPFSSGIPPAVATGKMAPQAPIAPTPDPGSFPSGENRPRAATAGGYSLAPPPPTPIVRQKTTSKPLLIGAVLGGIVLVGGAVGVGYRWGKETSDKQLETKQNDWKGSSIPQKERGEVRINKSYLKRVEVSFMDVAPQSDAEIVFVESNKGRHFPTGVKALVLQLQGNPPVDTQLTLVWKQGSTVIQRTSNRDELNNLGRLPGGANFGIYKTNRAPIEDGEYEVVVEEKSGEVAAYVKFVIGK